MDISLLFKFPGILILIGVILLVIAIVIGIIAYKTPAEDEDNNINEEEKPIEDNYVFEASPTDIDGNKKEDKIFIKKKKPVLAEEVSATETVENPEIQEENKTEEPVKEEITETKVNSEPVKEAVKEETKVAEPIAPVPVKEELPEEKPFIAPVAEAVKVEEVKNIPLHNPEDVVIDPETGEEVHFAPFDFEGELEKEEETEKEPKNTLANKKLLIIEEDENTSIPTEVMTVKSEEEPKKETTIVPEPIKNDDLPKGFVAPNLEEPVQDKEVKYIEKEPSRVIYGGKKPLDNIDLNFEDGITRTPYSEKAIKEETVPRLIKENKEEDMDIELL